MKMFVLGAGGLLGRAVVDAARHAGVLGGAATHGELDVCDTDAVIRAVGDTTHVVFAAAQPNVEGCERDPAGSRRVNVDAPRAVARRLAPHQRLVAFSTEYVFDGTLNRACVEGDATAPLNEYGRQKRELEQALRDHHLVLRVSGLYGPEAARKNFVLSLWDRASRGERLRVANDQMITPTYTPSLARLVVECCERNLSGILHLGGPQFLPRPEFARLALRARGFAEDAFDPVPTAELSLLAKRPLRAALDVSKARSTLTQPFVAPEEGLRLLAEIDGARPAGASSA